MRRFPAKSGKPITFGLLGLCLLAALGFAADLSAQAVSGCSRATLQETRLDQGLVLRFLETADALEKSADELGLMPAAARRSLSGTPSPTDVALSLERHETGRRLLERHLRGGQICTLIDFAAIQRTISDAQDFIDIGEDEEVLDRRLDSVCRDVCNHRTLMNIYQFLVAPDAQPFDETPENCDSNCRKSVGEGFRAPAAGNVKVLRSLQDEIPTAYIRSWRPGRSAANRR